MSLLEVENLKVSFHTRNGVVRAVDGVSFSIEPGETLGIVGESGSGKTVTGFSLMGLIPVPPGRIEGGVARFGGTDLLHCSAEELRKIRGRKIGMIFQDPMTSLNPYLRIEDQLIEPLLIHKVCSRREARDRAVTLMERVGIQDAPARLRSFPHQFSGGMRQRVVIAMALIGEPDLLIADEPTTALDVTVQAQILELIQELQRDTGTAVILISHDLGVVAGFCQRVNIMYAGRFVETGTTDQVFLHPLHPYNHALQRSIPAFGIKGQPLFAIPGLPPDLTQKLEGCAFAERCLHAERQCQMGEVHLTAMDGAHASACRRIYEGKLTLEEVSKGT